MNQQEVDIRASIQARSDQLNADDLIGQPRTIRVTAVTAHSADQPVAIHYEGGDGKPFLPCKSMRRVLVAAWGDRGADWVGRSMTLYNDPDVIFGGVKVGGIRVSHVSHIDQPLSILLTTTRSKRKPYVVKPLKAEVRAVRNDRPPLDLAPATETDAAFNAVIAAMNAATDADQLAEVVADADMDRFTEDQRNTARELYVAPRQKLRVARHRAHQLVHLIRGVLDQGKSMNFRHPHMIRQALQG